MAIQAKKDIVVGTTGWHKHLPELRDMVKETGLLYSTNFSLGMNLFFRMVKRAAELMNRAGDYDPFVHEIHHRQKVDSPSGTALTLARILIDGIDRKTEVLTQPPEGKIRPEMLHVSSTRAGAVAGTHTVAFESEADSIELKHVAKTRRGFALGAMAAARWLRGRKGIYTMDDVDL
jgi:4-hydroxy-tetrahydrodipicolinate reductase